MKEQKELRDAEIRRIREIENAANLENFRRFKKGLPPKVQALPLDHPEQRHLNTLASVREVTALLSSKETSRLMKSQASLTVQLLDILLGW